MGVDKGFVSGVWLRHLFKVDPPVTGDRGQKNRPKKCFTLQKKCDWRWLTNLEAFQQMHMAQRIMHAWCVYFFREGSSKLAGSPNLMVGKPSTPTSSPNSTDQSERHVTDFPGINAEDPNTWLFHPQCSPPNALLRETFVTCCDMFWQETSTSYITYVTYVFLQILHLSSPNPRSTSPTRMEAWPSYCFISLSHAGFMA